MFPCSMELPYSVIGNIVSCVAQKIPPIFGFTTRMYAMSGVPLLRSQLPLIHHSSHYRHPRMAFLLLPSLAKG